VLELKKGVPFDVSQTLVSKLNIRISSTKKREAYGTFTSFIERLKLCFLVSCSDIMELEVK
jgi:hypothetical protein